MFKQYEIVKFNWANVAKENKNSYPDEFVTPLVYLGEIPNMRDHCILIGKSGVVYWAYHTEDFITCPEDEL